MYIYALQELNFVFYNRYALQEVDMNLQDYDGRTALHLSAAEGHEDVTRFLINKCSVDPFIRDR